MESSLFVHAPHTTFRRSGPSSTGMDVFSNSPGSASETNQPSTLWASEPPLNLVSLPPEMRLKIWSHAVEPQIVFLNDIVTRYKACPLPGVTQLNNESRRECRGGYHRIGRGSYLHPNRDILICDKLIAEEHQANRLQRDVSFHIKRLALWDCHPDDRQAHPRKYEENLQDCFGRRISEKIEFSKLLFPNMQELWIVKIGDVHPDWGVERDCTAPLKAQLQQMARQFRYWKEEGIIEIAHLDLQESDTGLVLRQGRCREPDCRELNRQRPVMLSRVVFMDGKYGKRAEDNTQWTRLAQSGGDDDYETEGSRRQRAMRLRWALVERVLLFTLRWEEDDEREDIIPVHNLGLTQAQGMSRGFILEA